MAEVVLDANVLVAWLDGADDHATRAQSLFGRLKAAGDTPVLLSFVVAEACSVLCRRVVKNECDASIFSGAMATVRAWNQRKQIFPVETWAIFDDALTVMHESGGRLNFNDALLVVLQRLDVIKVVATYDKQLQAHPGFVFVE